MSLVNTNWLNENLNKVKIIDCSWHMPQTKRNGFDEYKKQHIKNAIYFDLDKNFQNLSSSDFITESSLLLLNFLSPINLISLIEALSPISTS